MKKIFVNIAFLIAATTGQAATVAQLDLRTVGPLLDKTIGSGFTNVKRVVQNGDKAVVSAVRLNKECVFLMVRRTDLPAEWRVDKYDCQR